MKERERKNKNKKINWSLQYQWGSSIFLNSSTIQSLLGLYTSPFSSTENLRSKIFFFKGVNANNRGVGGGGGVVTTNFSQNACLQR